MSQIINHKFDENGNLKYFPGNSIISFLNSSMSQYNLLIEVQNKIKEKNFSKKFVPLPPESFHVTIMDLLCDKVRDVDKWSKKIPLDLSFDEVDKKVIEMTKNIKFPIDKIKMQFSHISEHFISIFAALKPDENSFKALNEYREKIAESTGIRQSNFDSYGFHVTLFYLIENLSKREEEEFHLLVKGLNYFLSKNFGTLELFPPQLTFFNDMFNFPAERQPKGKYLS